ncbi:hypothetical protein RJD40_21165 [Vibrio scophthalmi]|uniref:hypothetical protein n=1 Tax=Vibrio scophthalmi TaxID=45658 RepID=UPI003AAD905D
MKYSPLAVHCTSLCFDIIQSHQFATLEHDDIDGFRDELYLMIKERTQCWPHRFIREKRFIEDVTNGVVSMLHHCLRSGCIRDPQLILSRIEECIDGSIRLHA